VPDVICHGGGELSESTRGGDGTSGQRPEENTPETRDTSAEELSAPTTPEGGVPVTEGDQSGRANSDDSDDSTDGPAEQPEPEFISPITFKTSGSFFRERVARKLVEQGFDADADGVTRSEDTGSASDASTDANADTGSARAAEDTAESGGAPSSATGAGSESADEGDSEPATEQFSLVGAATDAPAASEALDVSDAPDTADASEAPDASDEPAEPVGTDSPDAGTDWFSKPTPVTEPAATEPARAESVEVDTAEPVAAASLAETAAIPAQDASGAGTESADLSAGAPDTTEAFPATDAGEHGDSGPGSSDTAPEGTPSFSAAQEDTEPSLWPEPRRLSEHTSALSQGLSAPETASPTEGGTTGASDDTAAGGSASGAAAAGAVGGAGLAGVVGAASYSGASGVPGTPGTPGTPGGSGAPDTPGATAGSAAPGTPGEPDAFGSPAAPGAPGEHAVSGSAAAGAPGALSHGPGGPTGPGGPKGPGGPGGPTGPGGPKGGKGKKGPRRKKPLWWRILRVLLILMGLGIIAGCAAFAYFYTTIEVPDAAKAEALTESSTFYFADGETSFAERGDNREIISYEQMTAGGDHVVEAVISAEDRGFWTEPGVSVSGTTRAVWSTITGQQVQGGSTITQQMVRNYYEGVSLEQTVARKIQEIIIAIKIDRSETKEWVMEQYLNTIYFGREAYGIQAAAEAYYHKDVDELTAEEAAFLAAAIQQPTYFGEADVETTPAMERRWEYVVNGLVDTGAITQAEADAMEFPAPEAERPTEGTDLSGYRGYMLQEAMNELGELGYTEDQINRGGYKIVTTFDQDMMDAAYEAVESTVPPENLPEGVNVGLTTVDHATGEVLAFYGGHDYWENQYDSAFLGAAQAGSAFKPYVLATALEEGIGLNTTVDGRGPQNINGSRIQNAGNAPGGVMSLLQATQVSNNLGYIQLAERVGFENVRDTAYDVGLPEGSIGDDQLVPVMPLGAVSVRPVDQASGYSTFANGGVHVDTHVIKEIVNNVGEDERPEVASHRALEESTANDVTYALQQVVSSGTGTAANLWDHPTAGKTGTTNGSVAAWFVGYTPQLTTSVGVYNQNNESFSIPGYDISGGGLPATLWNTYMTRAMEGYEVGSFPGPSYGGSSENWAPVPTDTPEAPVEDGAPQDPVEPPDPETPVEPEPEVPPVETPPDGPGGTEPEPPPGSDPGDDGTIFPPGREDE
jgi:membrane peptidoglycan carboxypeptidase